MIQFLTGNILESEADALINTVNLKGVMGKGIALQFKKVYPNNYKLYKKACDEHEIGIGKLFVTTEENITSKKYIINFPTKDDWRKPSEYEYIEKGLDDLQNIITTYDIKSIAIPPLGSGNGGLNWIKVKEIIMNKLSNLAIDIFIYEPNKAITEQIKKEKVKLTDARALLLYVLFDLVRHGEFVSEFSSEKICYFLQKFGASNYFKLTYTPYYYGPYSGKVKYVLQYLNGSYIMGYSDMNKKPFETISLIADNYEEVRAYIEGNATLKEIADKTTKFLDGYYSDFALELLSSVDYIMTASPSDTADEVLLKIKNWNNRKSKMFTKTFVEQAYNYIKNIE